MAAKKKVEAPKSSFQKPTERDFAVILKPVITEKSKERKQNMNKVTVKVVDVRIVNVHAKATTRGTRYHGYIQGYKKAIVTIASGEAIDLFRE